MGLVNRFTRRKTTRTPGTPQTSQGLLANVGEAKKKKRKKDGAEVIARQTKPHLIK